MDRILLKLTPLGPFLLCFYLITHAKGTIECDRIGFGENNFETFCLQTLPPLHTPLEK